MLTVLNDLHLGPHRTGGTTPMSAALLTNYAHEQAETLLADISGPLLINGDLFDSFQVSNAVLKRTFDMLCDYLHRPDSELYLARGNHDTSNDTTKMSSFDLLGSLLEGAWPTTAFVITEPTMIDDADGHYWVIPHAPNQTIFDLWLSEVAERALPIAFVHANFDNNFALEKDHSLNLSREQLVKLNEAGVKTVVFGHEHQQKSGPGFYITGNQFPVSVSDCLGNRTKRYLQVGGEELTSVECWKDGGNYFECEWDVIASVPKEAQFVRIKGAAGGEQAADVFSAIAKLRKSHAAFVVSNAVTIDGQAMDVSALEAVESVGRFDVEQFLLDNLQNDAQRQAVQAILAKRHA